MFDLGQASELEKMELWALRKELEWTWKVLGIVMYIYNLSTQETKTRRLKKVWGQSGNLDYTVRTWFKKEEGEQEEEEEGKNSGGKNSEWEKEDKGEGERERINVIEKSNPG